MTQKTAGWLQHKTRQDEEARKHVCIVSWDKLDDVSQAENSVTHRKIDYKEADRYNINVIMEFMQSRKMTLTWKNI